jgi:hypothetical protein
MAVAQLIGHQLLQSGFVLLQNRFSQRLDGLIQRRLLGGLGERRNIVE